MLSRLSAGAAALSLVGVVALGAFSPAQAQDSNPGSDRCTTEGGGSGPGNAPGNSPAYPPAQNEEPAVSDGQAERGQEMSASSGCAKFAPGRSVAFGVESVFQQLGTVLASAGGEASATFTVPTNLSNGLHHVVFRGASLTGAPTEVRIPFTVAGGPTAAAPGTGAGPSQGAPGGGTVSVGGVNLPRTGSDEVVPLTLLGAGLLGAGAALVVVARRRRQSAGTLA